MRNYPTNAEQEHIPNVSFKRHSICQSYMRYGVNGDIQDYLMEQLEANPKLLAWIFDDSSLIGKSYLSLNSDQLDAFKDFYNSLSIYED